MVIKSIFIALLLIPFTTLAQAPSASVTIPAQPQKTLPPVSCKVGIFGGTCTITPIIPAQPAQTLPVTVSGSGFTMKCPNAPTTVAGQTTYAGCTLVVGK